MASTQAGQQLYRTQETPTREWLMARIVTLLSHYYQPDTDPDVIRAAAADWTQVLSGYPKDSIERACSWWVSKQSHRPTPADISSKCAEGSGAEPDRGDRYSLSYDERQVLEDKILPTAKRWLNIPNLRHHGIRTLEFWKEPFGA